MAERSEHEPARRRRRRAASFERSNLSPRQLLRPKRARTESELDIAGALQRMGLFKEATAFYYRTLESRPGSAEILRRLGDSLRPLGRLAEAEECYRLAIELDPSDPSGRYALGLVLHDMDRFAEAAEAYRAALALDPDLVQARFLLSSITGDETPPAAPRELIEDLFDLYAQRFDNHLRGALDYRAPEALRDAYEALRDKASDLDVIDLGCGTGLCGVEFRDVARRLVGVDLSSGMLGKARARGSYDELLRQDILDALAIAPGAFDLALAADVFVYIGDLRPVLRACRKALRPGGILLFTTESDDVAGYAVSPNGRYVHSPAYVLAEAANAGFSLLARERLQLRRERDEPVDGDLFALTVPKK